ncbi:MAG: FadR family transcriptional regulator [Spirochaetales bacterium]|nr:FadR family transcriptional regulator [Spirochaetales bacterium]
MGKKQLQDWKVSFDNIGKRETLPEKVCKTIKESILNRELKGGDVLPTEPELEKQFGVSRAVIRDAVGMLKAQGLIDVKHGKGMFVSLSQTEAFTDALLTTLRRDNASAWDVEQFEQILVPQIFSLASVEATDEDIEKIKGAATDYLSSYKKMIDGEDKVDKASMRDLELESRTAFRNFMGSIFESTHNKLIILLGDVLVSLRRWRTISEDPNDKVDASKIVKIESSIINRFVKAVEIRDPDESAKMINESINYDSSIISIMKNTPVGESPEIPGTTFFSAYEKLEE